MNKARVASSSPQPVPIGRTVPLGRVMITWKRSPYFCGEKGPQEVTLSGTALAVILKWIELRAPGDLVKKAQDQVFGHAGDIAERVLQIGRLTRALVESSEAANGAGDIFALLGEMLEDYATRIQATLLPAPDSELTLLLTAATEKAVA